MLKEFKMKIIEKLIDEAKFQFKVNNEEDCFSIYKISRNPETPNIEILCIYIEEGKIVSWFSQSRLGIIIDKNTSAEILEDLDEQIKIENKRD